MPLALRAIKLDEGRVENNVWSLTTWSDQGRRRSGSVEAVREYGLGHADNKCAPFPGGKR